MPAPLVHSLWLAEYDGVEGGRFIAKYPEVESWATFGVDEPRLAEMAYPSESKAVLCDHTYMILPARGEREHATRRRMSFISRDDKNTETFESYMYGLSVLMATPSADGKVLRRTLSIFSREPIFTGFKPLLTSFLSIHSRDNDCVSMAKNLESMLNQLNRRQAEIAFAYGNDEARVPQVYPELAPGEYYGVSLLSLVRAFKEDTMLIWSALLQQKRVLMISPSASEVGNCCLAAPLLVAPLKGFDKIIVPHVSSTDPSPLMRPSYICGATDTHFEGRADMADIVCSKGTVTIVNERLSKPTLLDREHVQSVLSGVEDGRGEQWLRDQFRSYTLRFLQATEANRLSKAQLRQFPRYSESPLFQSYVENRAEWSVKSQSEKSVVAKVRELKTLSASGGDAGDVEERSKRRGKIMFELSRELENLAAIEAAVEADAVGIVSDCLQAKSAQLRKYSASVLTQLAVSMKGQMAIILSPDLTVIVNLLSDEMPNVVKAAVYCLMKISTLYVGVHSLLDTNAVDMLLKFLGSGEYESKTAQRCATTLLQIYRFADRPEPAVVETIKALVLKTVHAPVIGILLTLLDHWGEDVSPLIPSGGEDVSEDLTALRMTDDRLALSSTFMRVFEHLASGEAHLHVFQLLNEGAVHIVVEQVQTCPQDHPAARSGLQLLTMFIDTHLGAELVAEEGFMASQTALVKESEADVYLFYLMRFFEFAAQQKPLRAQMLSQGVHLAIVSYIKRQMYNEDLVGVCVNGMRALLALLENASVEEQRELRAAMNPLETCVAAMRKVLESRKPEDGRLLHADLFIETAETILHREIA